MDATAVILISGDDLCYFHQVTSANHSGLFFCRQMTGGHQSRLVLFVPDNWWAPVRTGAILARWQVGTSTGWCYIFARWLVSTSPD